MEVINYKKSLINLSNSILKYFGVNTFHETLKEVDKILLEKEYKNVVLLLCDGMGSFNLKTNLSSNSFLIKNKIEDITTVFPPTTTAATTSALTGKTPSEHNWFGWNVYFKDTNETISLFINKKKDNFEIPKLSVSKRNYMKYESIIDLINKNTNNKAYYAYPFYQENPCNNLDEVINEITKLCSQQDKKFIYAYIVNPDKEMHTFGINSKEVKREINLINEKLEDLSKNLKDTILIVSADHGLIDTETIILKYDLPEIYNLLERTTSIEARTCGIKLKKEVSHEQFKKLYDKYLKKDFLCLTYEEVFKTQLFGMNDNKYLKDTIGDYLLVGIGNKAINYDETEPIFIGNHAGLTKRELEIPLIIIDCK